MGRHRLLLAAAAAILVAGCAATGNQTAQNNDPDDRAYITGSRIPVKDNGGQAAAAARAAANPDKGIKDQLMRGGATVGGVTGAGGN